MSEFENDWEPTGLYKAVLDARDELRELYPNGVDIHTHGMNAWARLTADEKRKWLPHALGAYVTRVHDEEHMKQMDLHAEDRTCTYLESYDVAILRDVAMEAGDTEDEVPAHRGALRNVLWELDLLQHRLRMRDQGSVATSKENTR
jgi:hypothetical protein